MVTVSFYFEEERKKNFLLRYIQNVNGIIQVMNQRRLVNNF